VRTKRSLLLIVAVLLTSAGCTRAPKPGEPIGREDVIVLADALGAAGAGISGLRGSGGGEAVVAGRGAAVSFAFVYSDPGWLRVDVRPEVGGLGAAFSSLSVLDGQCLRSYFPGQGAEVRGCLSDLVEAAPDVDLAGLALGIPRLQWLRDLSDPRLSRRDGRMVLTGGLNGRRVTLTADGDPAALSEVELELSPGGRTLRFTYSGRGRLTGEPLPRTIEIAVLDGRPAVEVTLEIKKARTVDRVARNEYELEVPPGARSLTWRDLEAGRKP
jgi:hypothetical protein